MKEPILSVEIDASVRSLQDTLPEGMEAIVVLVNQDKDNPSKWRIVAVCSPFVIEARNDLLRLVTELKEERIETLGEIM